MRMQQSGLSSARSTTKQLAGSVKTKSKVAFLTRCSPSSFKKLVGDLDKPKRQLVDEMGFGALLSIDCQFLCRDLCAELVNRFDCRACSLSCRGKTVVISEEDVALVLGIPCRGKAVDNNDVSDAEVEEVRKEFGSKKFKELRHLILSQRVYRRNTTIAKTFKRAFLLFALGVLLCPTSRMMTSTRSLRAVADIDHVPEYNWAAFVFKCLIEEVKKFKADALGKQSMGGCLYFLMIIFFHYFPLGDVVVSEMPYLVGRWTNEDIQRRLKLERESEQGVFQSEYKHEPLGHTVESFQHPVTREAFIRIGADLKHLDDALMGPSIVSVPMDMEPPSNERCADARIRRGPSSTKVTKTKRRRSATKDAKTFSPPTSKDADHTSFLIGFLDTITDMVEGYVASMHRGENLASPSKTTHPTTTMQGRFRGKRKNSSNHGDEVIEPGVHTKTTKHNPAHRKKARKAHLALCGEVQGNSAGMPNKAKLYEFCTKSKGGNDGERYKLLPKTYMSP